VSRVRIHIPIERWSSIVTLEAGERRHLIEVLRLRVGAQLEVFDGQGGICQATLIRTGKQASLEMGPRQFRPDSGPSTRMGLALLKGKKLDGVVRMLTEIGVQEIRPFTCQRSVSRPAAAALENRLKRWRSIAAEAARQCGRSSILEIFPCAGLDQVLGLQPAGELGDTVKVMMHEKAGGDRLSALVEESPASRRFVLVGPEGGFTESEVTAAREAGFSVAGLGLPVLRAETAAVAAAAFACLDRRPWVE
jgi:16S rRNA (uracil1498-N3)-methyltransferase